MRYLVVLLLLSFLQTLSVLALVPPAAVVHTACGFVAGSAGAIAAYPIDFVKSQLQTIEGRTKYAGGWQVAVEIVKEDGPLALYRGVLVNIVGIAPEKTIKLSVNDAARLAIQAQLGHLPLAGEMLAGGFAGMTQVIVTNPLEVVKVRMQTSDMTIQEVFAGLHGLGDFYQGAGACVVRDMTFSAVLFPLYAHAKVALAAALVGMMGHAVDAGAVSFWANMIAGSVAAAPAAIIATPADVVKTRLQQANNAAEAQQPSTPAGEGSVVFQDPIVVAQKQSAAEVLRRIVDEEGPLVLFSGCMERVVRSVPQFGVTLAVFDVLNSIALEHGWVLAAS